ncbi:MAG: hypothetical protein KAJ51_10570 [Thermoplasmata archaeon]|nr:hypothetical protein [Thermoplasmata archaeon]
MNKAKLFRRSRNPTGISGVLGFKQFYGNQVRGHFEEMTQEASQTLASGGKGIIWNVIIGVEHCTKI